MLKSSIVAVAIAFAACVPHRDLPPDQIEKLHKLSEVMDVQATISDPQFKKIDAEAYADADWAAFADMASRLQVTSRRIHEFTKDPGFDRLFDELHAKAGARRAPPRRTPKRRRQASRRSRPPRMSSKFK